MNGQEKETMDLNEIIEMADKAKLGSKAHFGFVIYQTSGTKELEAFAKLVAAKEREACAKLVEESSLPDTYSQECLPEIANDIRARGEA